MKRLAFALVALSLICFPVFAQNKGALTIQCNVTGAQVLINGRPAGYTTPNFAQLLNDGVYQITVKAKGFPDYTATVTMKGAPQTLVVNFGAQTPPPPPPAPTQYVLSVNSNVAGAEVVINGSSVGRTPFSAKVLPGGYAIVVKAPGFLDFSQTINVSGNQTVNATLQPAKHQIGVSANVPGAEVFINGTNMGKTPFSGQFIPGTYNVVVKAAGYTDYSQTVTVSGPVQVSATLQAQTFQLNVTANVQGAQVLLNGTPVGQTPFAGLLQPGAYFLTVTAPGFIDHNAEISMNRPQNVNVQLQPLLASWTVAIPDSFVNKDKKGGHWSEIQVYVDGVLNKGSASGQFSPGRHTIRVTSGGMAVETSFDAEAGKSYTVEAFMSLSVK